MKTQKLTRQKRKNCLEILPDIEVSFASVNERQGLNLDSKAVSNINLKRHGLKENQGN